VNRARVPDRSIPTESDAGSHILLAVLVTGPCFFFSPVLGCVALGLQIMWGISKAGQRRDYYDAHARRVQQASQQTGHKPAVGIANPYSRVSIEDGQPSAPRGHWAPNTMQF
jgi:hypothetical protein